MSVLEGVEICELPTYLGRSTQIRDGQLRFGTVNSDFRRSTVNSDLRQSTQETQLVNSQTVNSAGQQATQLVNRKLSFGLVNSALDGHQLVNKQLSWSTGNSALDWSTQLWTVKLSFDQVNSDLTKFRFGDVNSEMVKKTPPANFIYAYLVMLEWYPPLAECFPKHSPITPPTQIRTKNRSKKRNNSCSGLEMAPSVPRTRAAAALRMKQIALDNQSNLIRRIRAKLATKRRETTAIKKEHEGNQVALEASHKTIAGLTAIGLSISKKIERMKAKKQQARESHMECHHKMQALTLAMSLFDLQDVCIAIGSLATLDLPMVVDLIGIYVLKGPYCTLTTTNWFLQALSKNRPPLSLNLTHGRRPPPSVAADRHRPPSCNRTCSNQFFEVIPSVANPSSLLVQIDGGRLNLVVDLIGGSTAAYREEPVFL
ncbi:hypothetical protein F511_30722 [Dorcoceras hygrometricum]|uniref:Uncharacterized protein n=1 Tax=Dorcoceras hygrometricum TaxID=472368 RepID=A0A2Z7CQS8_9LAMI|nr:hypothetical protein F511_30722 [Dorcoceras hygrometricum]